MDNISLFVQRLSRSNSPLSSGKVLWAPAKAPQMTERGGLSMSTEMGTALPLPLTVLCLNHNHSRSSSLKLRLVHLDRPGANNPKPTAATLPVGPTVSPMGGFPRDRCGSHVLHICPLTLFGPPWGSSPGAHLVHVSCGLIWDGGNQQCPGDTTLAHLAVL